MMINMLPLSRSGTLQILIGNYVGLVRISGDVRQRRARWLYDRNGAGDTWSPTRINPGGFWVLEAPLAYALARPVWLGAHGVFVALAVAYSTLAVVSALVFRRGRWKAARV